MNRYWAFLGAGPFIAFVVTLFHGALEWMALPHLILFLVAIYLLGAIPAFLTCLVDEALSDTVGKFKRAGIAAITGCAFVSATAALSYGRFSWELARFGVVGSVAGLICSLLSSEKQNGRTQ